MEVAGVVLGSIPIILHALEKYQETYDTIQSFRRWGETLGTMKTDIFLQKRQLFTTLGLLDLVVTDQTTMVEIEAAVQMSHPEKCDDIIRIICQMNELMDQVAKNLFPDAHGPPTWSDAKSERISWEWRRVKRSFGTKERKQIIKQLQTWNTALQNCGLERRETLPNTENRVIERIKKTFDGEKIANVRENTVALHKAIKSNWGCTCSSGHRSQIELNWHSMRPLSTSKFHIALSTTNAQDATVETTWMLVSAHLEDASILTPMSTGGSVPVIAHTKPNISPLQAGLATSKVKFTGMSISSSLPIRSRSSPTIVGPAAQHPLANEVQPQNTTPIPSILLCSILQSRANGTSEKISGAISIPDSSTSKQVHMKSLDDLSNKSNSATTKKAIHLHTFLSRTIDETTNHRLALNRKQRFDIAAALCWAVLHLCGSPWLEETLKNDDIYLFLEHKRGSPSPIVSDHPYLSCTFKLPSSHPASLAQLDTALQANEFQSNQIQNRTLYTLAIRLIELGLNKSFSTLRQEYYASMSAQAPSQNQFSPTSPSSQVVDDYDIAQYQISELILDPGISYGHAVDRCLRFLFPGPPERNTFEYANFRSTFFADVVAPIQAVFELIPWSALQIGQ